MTTTSSRAQLTPLFYSSFVVSVLCVLWKPYHHHHHKDYGLTVGVFSRQFMVSDDLIEILNQVYHLLSHSHHMFELYTSNSGFEFCQVCCTHDVVRCLYVVLSVSTPRYSHVVRSTIPCFRKHWISSTYILPNLYVFLNFLKLTN